MIFLVSEFDPKAFSLESPALTKRLSADSIRYLRQWQEGVRADVDSLPDDQITQYAVPIDLSLSVVNKQSKADVTAALFPQAGDSAAVSIKVQRLIDQYQHSHKSIVRQVKAKRPGTKVSEIIDVIRRCGIKGNPEFSAYNFRTKEQEQEYLRTQVLPQAIPVLYSIKVINYILQQLGPSPAAQANPEQAPGPPLQPDSQTHKA